MIKKKWMLLLLVLISYLVKDNGNTSVLVFVVLSFFIFLMMKDKLT